MIFRIVTLFPDFFSGPLQSGLTGRAVEKGLLKYELLNLREFTEGTERCDDYPYGGGSGMVLKPEPIFRAVEPLKKNGSRVILTSPSGTPLTQARAAGLSREDDICIICGHYEGVDRRVTDLLVDEEISTGDYILSRGEIAALAIMDSVARQIPGFMQNPSSLEEESFNDDLLEYPQYTRPEVFRGSRVPEELLSGDHKKIHEWRMKQRISKTGELRPDLFKKYLIRKLSGD